MTSLDRCTELWGAADILEHDPHVQVVSGALYLPLSHGGTWGLFEADGRPIQAAVDLRERKSTSHNQKLSDALAVVRKGLETAPAGTYIYGGTINPHYGHFLVNTLPRFWCMTRIRTPNTRILCHGGGRPADWFRIPFISDLFSLLGLTPGDFACFDRPTKLSNVVIPGTSLEEQAAGYRSYSALCREIGARICGKAIADTNETPIYYSKARLKSAVGNIVNEAMIDDVLKQEGVEIVYPETLSFFDQVRTMTQRTRILGSSGSFLHTSIFCPPRNITCLNVSSQINSNYIIIDRLSNSSATYHYPRDIEVLPKQQGFLTSRFVPNPHQVARDLLTAAK